MNYYEHHLGDYAKDTGHLSMLEHGAYRLLLDRYYSTEEGIPAAQAYRLARARSEEERQAVDVVLGEFFELVEGVWINGRAEEEIAKAKVRIDAAKSNGKLGGRPKKKPAGSEMETQKKAHQAPDTSKPLCSQAASTTLTEGAREDAVSPPPAQSDPIHRRAIELTAMLRQRGASLQASDPRVIRWAQTAVSDAQALLALERAQQRRHDEGSAQPINAGLLDSILADIRQSPKENPNGKPQRRTAAEQRASTIAELTGRHRRNDHADARTLPGEARVVD